MPDRAPELTHEPTDWATVLFIVPATNPAPVTAHVTAEIGIVAEDERRSSDASTDRLTVLPTVVRTLVVMVIAPPPAWIWGVVSGFSLPKEMLVVEIDSFASAPTVILPVALRVRDAASRHTAHAATSAMTVTARTRRRRRIGRQRL